MIYNLTDILRETMKQSKNKNKNIENQTNNTVRKIPSSFIENNKSIFPYNLKIDVELANRKTMDLYTKYYNFNTNLKPKPIPRFSFLDNKENNHVTDEENNKDTDEEINKDNDEDNDEEINKDNDEENNKIIGGISYEKTGLTICGICVFAFLAYSYFKKG
jgi:hypothetical protein